MALEFGQVGQVNPLLSNRGFMPMVVRRLGTSATAAQLIDSPAHDDTEIDPGWPFGKRRSFTIVQVLTSIAKADP